MADFTKMAYSPEDGIKDQARFRTNPSSEEEARAQFQDMFDQVTTYINGTLLPQLSSANTGLSGAERIGSAAIANLSSYGVSPVTVRDQIALLKTQLDKLASGDISVSDVIESLDGGKIIDGTIGTEKIADGTITASKLADGAINAAILTDGSVETSKLADGAVMKAKIASGAVTEEKIGENAITNTKIMDGEVITAKLGNKSVSDVKLAADAVTTDKIKDLNVTEVKLASNAVTTAKITDGAITSEKIADGAVTTADITAGAVTEIILASNAVTTAKIMDDSVTTAKLENSSVTTEKLSDYSVTKTKTSGLFAWKLILDNYKLSTNSSTITLNDSIQNKGYSEILLQIRGGANDNNIFARSSMLIPIINDLPEPAWIYLIMENSVPSLKPRWLKFINYMTISYGSTTDDDIEYLNIYVR